jgi:effector-binding domain-containing protein
MAGQQAFPPTAPGVCELKTLPAGMLLKSEGSGNYFNEANGLFRPLFNYISSHNIAMTTPVEARIENAAMYFWVAESEKSKVPGAEGGVKVVEVPARSVASIGGKGSYSRENFEKARDALQKWLALRKDVEPIDTAYAVYWNGPFTPWFLKRYEVHVPVRAK